MNKSFDEKNAAKSRARCAEMAEAASTGKRVLTERERQILALWPKWSNGDYCMFGDLWTAQPYGEREPKQLTKLSILSPKLLEEWDQAQGENFAYEWDFLRPADTTYRPEKAERPALQVRDADGVEIKVGDRIYSIENGNSYTVRSINGSGTIEFKGFDDKGWFPKYFTHMQPAIDADGVLIKVGDTVWFKGNPRPYAVVGVKDGSVRLHSKTYCSEESATTVWTDILTHIAPDSWELLEEDAAELDDMPCDFNAKDLIRRAKALAGVEVAE